jgi:hypothetical protein
MKMNANQIVLYATNEGKLYNEHRAYAADKVGTRTWETHVIYKVLPLYRKEFHEPFEGASHANIEEAAVFLQKYYIRELEEEAA